MNDNRNFRGDQPYKVAGGDRSALSDVSGPLQLYGLPDDSQESTDEMAELVQRLKWVKRARLELTNRRRRIGIFGATMFGEPGWEVLLTLYASDSRHQTIARISKTVSASWSSTLRWIDQLDDAGMLTREPNPTDGRSVLVAITPKAVKALDVYFAQMPNPEE